MTEVFVNKDAEFLAQAVAKINSGEWMIVGNHNANEAMARLLQIARNLQSLDDKSAGAYSQGWRDGNAAHLARSNLVQTSRPIAPNLAQAMAEFRGEITRLPTNAPKVEMDNTLSVADLDLE